MTEKALITGAESFTGHYVAERLAAAGFEVHGVVREAGAAQRSGLAGSYACEVNDAARLASILAEVSPAVIVHLVAIAFVAHGDAGEIYQTNLVGTRNLLEAALGQPTLPRCVLLPSSANIYGNSTAGRLGEDTPPAPANDYAVSKLAMEYLARLYADRLPLILTRPFNYTGIGQSESFLLPKIVAHARRRAPVLELGNLDVARDFSDVRTVADAYVRLVQTPAAIGQTFNVCSGEAHSLHDVLAMIARLSGHAFDVRVNPAFMRANEVKVLLGDKTRLEACIGPVAPIPLEQTLRWMMDA